MSGDSRPARDYRAGGCSGDLLLAGLALAPVLEQAAPERGQQPRMLIVNRSAEISDILQVSPSRHSSFRQLNTRHFQLGLERYVPRTDLSRLNGAGVVGRLGGRPPGNVSSPTRRQIPGYRGSVSAFDILRQQTAAEAARRREFVARNIQYQYRQSQLPALPRLALRRP